MSINPEMAARLVTSEGEAIGGLAVDAVAKMDTAHLISLLPVDRTGVEWAMALAGDDIARTLLAGKPEGSTVTYADAYNGSSSMRVCYAVQTPAGKSPDGKNVYKSESGTRFIDERHRGGFTEAAITALGKKACVHALTGTPYEASNFYRNNM